jgi:UDP-3-O-[3-hydroxymyristoyl] glucosamine N-acyltransferase
LDDCSFSVDCPAETFEQELANQIPGGFVLRAETIKERHSDLFTFLQGDLTATATQCHRPEETDSQSLVYLSEQEHLDTVLRVDPAIIVVHAKLLPGINGAHHWGGCLFSVTAIPSAMAALLKYFDRKPERFSQWGEHHPTAVVHPTATVGKNVVLGPYCVIGAGSIIGDDCLIGSHTVVENAVSIGARTILHAHVFVGSACKVGTDCEIHPHSSVGSDGFGYARSPEGKPIKICQLGNVVIGDEVEIGSNCAIDRATLTSTFIRSGTKLDNICHIAHNCDLGENGLYTAGFMMAGSTKIGRGFVTGGNTVVSAHLTVADNVMLAGRSSVTNDVTKPGAYGGYPLQPLQDALKTAVNITRIAKLRRDLRRVMKHLGLSSEDCGN